MIRKRRADALALTHEEDALEPPRGRSSGKNVRYAHGLCASNVHLSDISVGGAGDVHGSGTTRSHTRLRHPRR